MRRLVLCFVVAVAACFPQLPPPEDARELPAPVVDLEQLAQRILEQSNSARSSARLPHLALISAQTPDPADELIRLWLGSTAHRTNLLDQNFNRSGVGVAQRRGLLYAVQVYAHVQRTGPGRD